VKVFLINLGINQLSGVSSVLVVKIWKACEHHETEYGTSTRLHPSTMERIFVLVWRGSMSLLKVEKCCSFVDCILLLNSLDYQDLP
jgi:hypothetical protein